jgi:3-deoxy-D-manno-octulosonate 8-phosphate phosphatase (KDO 8-P phosphatase)
MPLLSPTELVRRQQSIELLILDVDGVLTDGSLFLGDAGEQYKAFHSRDGHGLRMAMEGGLQVAVLTGRHSEVVLHRMRELGIPHILQGRRDKGHAFAELLAPLGIAPERCAFLGDDLVDLPAMRRSGLGIAVADAHPLVLEQADWHTQAAGGRGAVREVCETLLQAQGRWEGLLRAYLEG